MKKKLMEKHVENYLKLINFNDVKEIKQELIVNWVKNENNEYIYNGFETTTTIKG